MRNSRERILTSHVGSLSDCGLGGRIYPDIAWAKLQALAEGAAIASQR